MDTRERRNSFFLFGMIVIMGLLDLVGVASIMPFIAVLSNPQVIHTNKYLSKAYDQLGFGDTDSFLIFLGVATFCMIVGSLAFKAFAGWTTARYVQMRNYTFGSRLLRSYLARPYTFFLNRHSSDLSKRVLSEVAQVIGNTLKPVVDLVANTVVTVLLVSLIVAVNPIVALSAVTVLGGTYAIIYFFLRNYLSEIGERRVRANQRRYQIIQEALGGIKDVKVLALEDAYVLGFRKPAQRFARVKASSQIVAEIPRLALQALVFGGMLAILLSLIATEEYTNSQVIPLMTLYAVAATRLIPAMQIIFKSVTSLRFGKHALDLLYSDFLDSPTGSWRNPGVINPNAKSESRDVMPFKRMISLEDVSYSYPGTEKKALADLTLSIETKTTIGFVGSTGAGKTTAVDIILGLLEPQKGYLRIDDEAVTRENVASWQRNIGYVPQHIFLTDDTVAANIAFGVPARKIDYENVERVSRVAALHEFVVEEMPEGYDTFVGERGVRLSGGQLQRIGIARALYRDPEVLVLDEATSALDTLTASAVMDAVHNLAKRKTIIIIAHRLISVRECHNIFLLQRGRLVGSGTYDELLENNKRFKAMVAG